MKLKYQEQRELAYIFQVKREKRKERLIDDKLFYYR
jgi:hypothetical protein